MYSSPEVLPRLAKRHRPYWSSARSSCNWLYVVITLSFFNSHKLIYRQKWNRDTICVFGMKMVLLYRNRCFVNTFVYTSFSNMLNCNDPRRRYRTLWEHITLKGEQCNSDSRLCIHLWSLVNNPGGIHSRVCICICVCVCLCMYLYLFACTCICIRICVVVSMFVYMCLLYLYVLYYIVYETCNLMESGSN